MRRVLLVTKGGYIRWVTKGYKGFLSYKGWYSTILLAIADQNYKCLYMNVGSPGRNHDAGVFENSKLPGVLASPLFKAEGRVVAGVAV